MLSPFFCHFAVAAAAQDWLNFAVVTVVLHFLAEIEQVANTEEEEKGKSRHI